MFIFNIYTFSVFQCFVAAIVQWLERLIVVQDVEGSNPSSRPILISSYTPPSVLLSFQLVF